ncbi:MAG: hypothetical protein IRZ21_07950 [Thermoleophilaceae bacterium]|nr:hypothetical protein [Thermoleophilaceae bacterium]
MLDALAAADPARATREPWRALLERAEERRAAAEEAVERAKRERLEVEPKGRERRALEREFDEAARRDGRRARTEVLDLGLELAAIGFRDLLALQVGAPEAVLASDRIDALRAAAGARRLDPLALRRAAELCEEARQSLELNVSEDLALAALTFRLRSLLEREPQSA